MRYSAEHKEQTRERIIRAAARRFRSRGSEGAAIADLMRELKLTHGGFYRHFKNKEDLFVQALEPRLTEISKRIASAIEHAPPGGELKAFIDAYLDIQHCENAGEGCPVAALATELARHPPRSRVRLAFEKILKERTGQMAKYMPGKTEDERARQARMLMSGMAGSLTIARALTEEQARRKFLDDAKDFYFKAVHA